MELHYQREASVGLLVILASVTLVLGLMWLKGKSLRGEAPVVAQFETVAGLKVGDPVLVAGVRVGRVRGLELRGLGDVRASLDVDHQWRPRADARAWIVAVGLVGDHAIEYWPGTSDEPLAADAVVPGAKSGGLVELAEQLGARADTVMTGVQGLLSPEIAGDVGATLAAARRAMNTISALGSGPAVGQALAALAELERLAARLDTTLKNPGLVGALDNLDGLTAQLDSSLVALAGVSEQLQGILTRMESGQGTLGRLATDTLLYTEMTRVSTALANVLEDLQKQPGKYVKISIF